MRHVVGAVAEVGQRPPGERALALDHRLQVGQDLARVVLVGERVDHRHPADRRHGLDAVLAEGAPDDRGDLPVEHAGGVLDRLAAAELAAAGVDDQRVAAELGDADREGHPGAGRRLVEQHGDRRGTPSAASGIGASAVCRVRLERGGQRQHLGLLGRAEVVVLEEVPGHGVVSIDGVEGRGQGRDEGVDLRVGEDERRGEPEHVGRDGVGQEAGGAQLRLQRAGDVGGQDDAEQRTPPAHAADAGVAERPRCRR